MGADGTILEMERVIKKAEKDKGSIPPQWSEQARRAEVKEIDQATVERLDALRVRGLEELDAELETALQDRYKAQLAAGPKGEQWGEASARSQFVREDVASMAPEEIPRAYRAAKAVKDDVGAWLIQYEGRRRLAALKVDDEAQQGMAARKAIDELQGLAWGGIEAKHQKQVSELGEQRLELVRTAASYRDSSQRPIVRF